MILNLVDEFEGTLARKRGEVNQESTLLDRSISDNTDYSDPIANWYPVDISYTPMDDYWDKNWPR
jgi:hypothetical protein